MARFVWELANADVVRKAYEEQLRHGEAYVPGVYEQLAVGEPCTLEILNEDTGDDVELACTVARIETDPPMVVLAVVGQDRIVAFVSGRAERSANVYDKLRQLSTAQQLKLARRGELSERVAIERMYGKAVWGALLANPRITIPEVARIARKRTVPRPLLEQIADNAGWARAAPVRRALLSNPRAGLEAVNKVLRMTPRNELKLMDKQLGYPSAVRDAARRLLGRK